MKVALEEHELTECLEVELEDLEELKVAAGDDVDVRMQKIAKREIRVKKDRRCKSLLVSRIHDTQLEYVQEKETPKQIWDALIRVFERKSIASRMHLKRKMLSMRFETGTLQDHFLRFDRLVREYRNTGAAMEDLDIICHLLLTLGPAYSTIVTALETMPEENLSLEFIKCRLLDEEIKQKGIGIESVTTQQDGAAFTSSKKQWSQKKKLKCYGCQEEGHKLIDCPRNKQQSKANLAEENSVSFITLIDGSNISDRRKVQWIIDSGCSDHIVNDKQLFENLELLKNPIEIAVAKNGEWITAYHSGTVRMISIVNGKRIPCTVHNVLYVPSLRCNLFSVLKIESKGMKVVFSNGKVYVYNRSEVVATGVRHGKLYELDFYTVTDCKSDSMLVCGRIDKSLELWHRRFGHLNMKHLKHLINENIVDGLATSKVECDDSIVCEPCVIGKQTRKPFVMCEGKRSSRVLELIHSDVCGPVTPVGRNGERFFVTFIDDWTHFVMVFPMKSKHEVCEWFEYYEALVTAKFGNKISKLKCDNGGEYYNKTFIGFCRRMGIQVEWTVPYTPEQNGTSERMNRTLVERARSMLEDARIDKVFWVQAVQVAAYISNRCPTSAIVSGKTPFEIWEGRKPNVSRFRVFGSSVFVHVPKERRKKLDAKAWKGIFVGYSSNGYRVWNPERNEIIVARDVDFIETPVSSKNADEVNTFQSEDHLIRLPALADTKEQDRDDENARLMADDEEEYVSSEELMHNEEVDLAEENIDRRPVRDRKAPNWHQEYEVEYASYALNALNYVEDLPEKLSDLKERSDWPEWQKAMQEEMDSLMKNNTWTLSELPVGRSAITCKWVFKIKQFEDNQPSRYKARLVARGFSQKYGFDYMETYSPVARLDTLRVVLALANREGMTVHHMDVKTAFLNGELSEEIYMVQPEGYDKQNGLVCRLNRSLYGLKQASRSWNERFHQFMEKLNFKRSDNDPCLYTRGTRNQQIILVLYVDDVLVACPSVKLVNVIKNALSREFEMTDVGEVSCFLGMRIERDENKKIMRISQRNYLVNLLNRFHMSDCRPISTPLENKLKLVKGTASKKTNKPYRELVGCIMYVSMTSRPDLAAAANYYSQFQSCPEEEHWVHLRRVLRYVKETLHFGLVYRGESHGPLLEAYTDADWGNDISDRHSISGAVFKVFGSTVSWIAKKQTAVSLSSTEAELVALTAAACYCQWLIRILRDLDFTSNDAIPIHEDNQSTIRIASNPKYSARLKHMDVKHFFVRELIASGCIAVDYVPSAEQQADMLTKGLPAPAFRKLRSCVGITDCSV